MNGNQGNHISQERHDGNLSHDGHDRVVQTHELTKRYGDRLAANRVSMTVGRGEVYGFLGPNGAGKTTTLRMILGLVRPTSGSAVVLGHDPGKPEVIAQVGALIEGPGFFPYLSGRDNLRVMGRYRGLPEETADAALERVDLGSRGGDKFKSYSLGMKQRLGVASALMGEPALIILDEPTNGLDPAGMVDMRRLIVDLARGGQTVLLSSHLLDEVQEICDRVGVINEGVLLKESTVAELRGGASLTVVGRPLDRALAVAMGVAGDDGVRVQDDTLVVQLEPERAPELVHDLVVGGVEVYEVRSAARTLEEVFFEMTRNERHTEKELEATR